MKKHFIFYSLVLTIFVLASYLNYANHQKIDISRNQHNSISPESIALLAQFNGNIHFSVYANNEPLKRQQIKQWFNRYQHNKADMTIEWINPETSPTITRNLNIAVNGTVIIEHNNQQQRIERISETTISNALYKLIKQQTKTLVFLTGHGERSPFGVANHDWKDFADKLALQGTLSDTRNLFKQASLNPDTEILVIASPLTNFFEQEKTLIKQFINDGGNLFIITDAGKNQPLDYLLEPLHVHVLPGVIVDATTQSIGIQNVDFAVINEYTGHPLTKNFNSLTLYPQTAALDIIVDFDILKMTWDIYPFLSTSENSWTETSKIEGNISYNINTVERAGPLDIGLLLSKTNTKTQTEQRIIVMGDGDFIANAYMGNGGNLALGHKMIQWLSSNDQQLKINNQLPSDLEFELSEEFKGIVGLGFLIVLPLGLLLIGFIIKMKRRR